MKNYHVSQQQINLKNCEIRKSIAVIYRWNWKLNLEKNKTPRQKLRKFVTNLKKK